MGCGPAHSRYKVDILMSLDSRINVKNPCFDLLLSNISKSHVNKLHALIYPRTWIWIRLTVLFFAIARYNSSAATSKSSPSPWRSPTVTDRRRNESAWEEQRFRLLPSYLLTRHSHHCGNRTPSPPFMRTLQAEWTVALYSTVSKHTHTYRHTRHSHAHTHSLPTNQTLVSAMGRAQGLRLPFLVIG